MTEYANRQRQIDKTIDEYYQMKSLYESKDTTSLLREQIQQRKIKHDADIKLMHISNTLRDRKVDNK